MIPIQVGQIFRSTQDGKYVMGLSASLAAILLAGVGQFVLYLFLRKQNKDRDSMTEDEKTRAIGAGKTGDFHPDYRYAL